jgi:Predicted metal binding domain/Protein of Unknown function (DUF2604)
MSSNKRDLAVIVNGQPTVVSANVNAPLHTIIPKALEQTGNLGQPPENWELRDSAGVALDADKKIASFDFEPDVKLFLSLKAGVGGEAAAQYVDPAVSLAKFDQEIAEYRDLQRDYERRGWFLIEAKFPEVFVVMATVNLRPPALLTGVHFDYANYDAEPPSVRLVDPFTRDAYAAKDLPTTLNRALPAQQLPMPGMPGQLQVMGAQPLMQAHTPEELPFLCIAGVREYHEHPGHTGDVWELHRASGAGKLVRLIEVIHRYGVEPVRGYGVNLVPQVTLDHGEPPQ